MGEATRRRSWRDNYGYKNDHHLIQEKVVGQALVNLRTELAEPAHLVIRAIAQKQPTFEAAIGQITACLGIVVDGSYDPDALFGMLTTQLQARRLKTPAGLVRTGGLIPMRVEETDAPDQTEQYLNLLANSSRTIDQHSLFMLENGCEQCDNRAACIASNRCLGNDSVAEDTWKPKE